MVMPTESSFKNLVIDGSGVDVKLLRAVALGGKHSSEIQLLLEGETGENGDYQKLALILTGLSVQPERGKVTFEKLRAHQIDMQEAIGRTVMIKTAAMDLLERIEAAQDLPAEEMDLTYDQLVQLAFRDHLTDLSNYRHFTLRLEQELLRARRYKHLLSLIMIDLDRFKDFNDRLGHTAGNEALIHLAKTLKDELRDTDLKVRYGGEEFAILLPETTKHEAAQLAENLRALVENNPVRLEGMEPQPLTISLGVATFWRDASDGTALISNADQALYASKNTGRNRVSLFEPELKSRFQYRPDRPGAAQSATVVGDFNGWDISADPMEMDKDGFFVRTIHLAPGSYRYKFVINSEFYITDPARTGFEQDGYGGRNSILVVEDPDPNGKEPTQKA